MELAPDRSWPHHGLLDLAQVDPEQPDLFGGKACGLARLIAAGANVPPGFALEVTSLLPADWPETIRVSFLDRVRALLAEGPVAVRSSAAGEDGALASFAGQFETVLQVDSENAALEAAARCISSGHGEPVRAYTHGKTLPVGVVVQHQVDPTAAGVCFTVDPTGQDTAVLVEAVAGLGDRLVSGREVPDRWRVYETATGEWEARSSEPPRSPVGPDPVCRLAREARSLADHLGRPLDLEWAIDTRGRIHWLQARPITAAVPPPALVVDPTEPGADDGPLRIWANFNLRETMPDPLPPFSWSMWRDLVPGILARLVFGVGPDHPVARYLRVVDRVNGRAYWNINALAALPGLAGPGMQAPVDLVDPQLSRMLDLFARESRQSITQRRFPESRLVVLLRLLHAALCSLVWLPAVLSPRRMLAQLERFGARERQRRARNLEPLTDGELVRELEPGEAGLDALGGALQAIFIWIAALLAGIRLFRRFPDAVRSLTAGTSRTHTAMISLELDALVQQARPLAGLFEPADANEVLARLRADETGRAWLREFHEFLDRNSQRCPREFDVSVPRWDEDPRMILGLVKTGLGNGGEPLATKVARQDARRRADVEEAIARSSIVARPLMRVVARLVEAYLPLREAPKHFVMITFQCIRRAALELGRRFVARGVLAAPDDVFFLERGEIASLASGRDLPRPPRELVAVRREQHRIWQARKAEDLVRSDGVPVRDVVPEIPGTLAVGVAASPGVASGPVRVLTSPDPEALRDGEVMVVELADPGWTPLFSRASAIVMEVGGVTCHAAVVARELGIPAVSCVRDARARLRDRQRIVVDGDRGLILDGDPRAGDLHSTAGSRPRDDA